MSFRFNMNYEREGLARSRAPIAGGIHHDLSFHLHAIPNAARHRLRQGARHDMTAYRRYGPDDGVPLVYLRDPWDAIDAYPDLFVTHVDHFLSWAAN